MKIKPRHVILAKILYAVIALAIYGLFLLAQRYIPKTDMFSGNFTAFVYAGLTLTLLESFMLVFCILGVFQYFTGGAFDISFISILLLNYFYVLCVYFLIGKEVKLKRVLLCIIALGCFGAVLVPLVHYIRTYFITGHRFDFNFTTQVLNLLGSLTEWRFYAISVGIGALIGKFVRFDNKEE